MPIHDWTRVTAGTWHDFHLAWITEIRNALLLRHNGPCLQDHVGMGAIQQVLAKPM